MSSNLYNTIYIILRICRLPVSKALISQLTGGIFITLAALQSQSELTSTFSLIHWALISGAVSASIGLLFGMAFWWVPINLTFPLAIYFAISLSVPGWVYLTLFGLLAAFYSNSALGVPLYLTNRKTMDGIATILPHKAGIKFLDVGCGIGGTLAYISSIREDGKLEGVESAPFPFIITWFRILLDREKNIQLHFGNMWDMDLSKFDVVYAFLSPVPMAQLFLKVRSEMRHGSLFISNSFEVPDEEPTEILKIDDRRKTKLFIWRL